MIPRGWRWVAALNAAFVLYGLLYAFRPEPALLAPVIAAMVLVVPGLGWLRLCGRWAVDRAAAMVLTLGLSAAAGAAALVVQMLLGVKATPATHAAALALVTNLGLFLARSRPWPEPARPAGALPGKVLLGAALPVYAALFLSATRFVPPMPDQDIEVQGTAYGIVRRGVPLMLHDRRLPYHFAHPHLLHWLSAEGILLSGELEAVRPYYDAALRAEELLSRPLVPGGIYESARRIWDRDAGRYLFEPIPARVESVEGGTVVLDRSVPVRGADGKTRWTRFPTRGQFIDGVLSWSYRRLVEATFERRPLLWQTRGVNLGLALAALFLLSELGAVLGGSRLAALLVPVTWGLLPEVLGRLSCASYMGLTVVLLVAVAWWHVGPRRGPRGAWPWGTAFAAGLLLALANHKAAAALAGMVLAGLLADALKAGWRAGLRRAFASPAAWGFAAGTALFWTYGFSVAPEAFIADHLRYHLLNRVMHRDALAYVKPGVYPSVGGLWWGLVRDSGFALPAVAVAALAWLAAAGKARSRAFLVILGWGAAVGVVFSVIDWRQTKHLMHLVPVLVLAPAAAWGAADRLGRLLWPGLLAVALAAALFVSVDWVRHGFASLRPAGGW